MRARRARSRARLRAVPRGARARSARRRRRAGSGGGAAAAHPRDRERRDAAARPRAARRAARRESLRGPGRRRRARRRSCERRCATCTTACRWTRCASAAILAARALIEKDPAYSYVTARLLLHTHPPRGAGRGSDAGRHGARATPSTSRSFIKQRHRRPSCSTRRWLQFDLKRWARRSKPERDLQFGYLGLQTLYDRYFLHVRRRSASSCRRRSSCAWRWAWR